MDDVIEREVANHNVLLRELADKVADLSRHHRRSPGGLILPTDNVSPGPGNAYISRAEHNRQRDAMVAEIESLKAQVVAVSELAMEAVRILDRMAGME